MICKTNVLLILFLKGNSIETYFDLVLLTQLSFSDEIKYDMNRNAVFRKRIDELDSVDLSRIKEIDEKEIFSSIKQLVERLKWNLNETKKTTGEHQEEANEKHVMISYNSASRAVCLKIKQSLEAAGYKVWIDVDNIHGSSLEAMAQAVEKSCCVLMCVTEKYRQSINCQAEAQYAFKVKKHIIPLIMQDGYENVKGWLGIIMGDKIFINFSKYEFEKCMSKLKRELEFKIHKVAMPSMSEKTASSLKTDINAQNSPLKNSNLAENWTESEVRSWFIKNDISLLIFDYFKPCNGKILLQLYEMNVKSPDFYNKNLKEIKGIKFNSIVLFSACLADLFRKN